MTLSAAQLGDLSDAIADRIYVQVAGWHLYLGDAKLARPLAEELAGLLSQGTAAAVRMALERLQVPIGAGSTRLPLARLIPPANSSISRRFLNPSAAILEDRRWRRMLVIEVTNAREVVRKRVGRLGERLLGTVVDAEAQVERALLQELETAFREFGIQARIYSVEGMQMIGRSHLELPVTVRDQRTVD